jgi:hypothetical protein
MALTSAISVVGEAMSTRFSKANSRMSGIGLGGGGDEGFAGDEHDDEIGRRSRLSW